MRLTLLLAFCLLGLTGCVNYYGTKSDVKPLTAAQLSTQKVYSRAPTAFATPHDWWKVFHNPQLNQLIETALKNSPSLQNAASRIRGAQQLTNSAKTALWPSIDAEASYTRERFAAFGLIPPPFNNHTFNIADIALNLNYELDVWGKNRQFLAARISETCAAQADWAQARLMLSTAVASTYFELQSAIKQRRIAENLWRVERELLAINKVQGKRGIVSASPIKVSTIDEQSARLDMMRLLESEKLKEHQLAYLLGENARNTKIKVPPFRFTAQRLRLPASLPANLLAVRPDIIAARLRTEAAAHQINVAKARLFPNINLIGLFSYQTIYMNRLFDPSSQNNGIQGAIDLPIFDAGARRAAVAYQYAEYDSAVTQYNQTILDALRQVADEEIILQSVTHELQIQDQATNAAQKSYELAKARYQHGIIDYSQMLTTKSTFWRQQAVLVDLKVRHIQATIGLIRAMGGSELIIKG